MHAPAPLAATPKRSLVVLSHAMERAFDQPGHDDEPPGLVLALFQRREFFDREAKRYAALAAAGHTVIVAFQGSVDGVPAGVHAVARSRRAIRGPCAGCWPSYEAPTPPPW